MMRITSAENPLARRLVRLADSPRASRTARRTLAEGLHLIEGALDAGLPLPLVVLRGAATPAARALAARAAAARAQIVEFAPALFDRIAPVEQGAGLLAEIEVRAPALPCALVVDAVYLDGVQDPGNAGAILRTAAAAGVRHVAAAAGSVYLWAPRVLRAAMGAHFALALYENVTPDALAAAFSGERLAADAHATETLYQAAWGDGPTVWLFGSEGQGLGAPAAAAAQRRLRIPVSDAVESLNVAAAAAVCLFEQHRRREQAPRERVRRPGKPR
jgi:TrmH family RNA methyltransferase